MAVTGLEQTKSKVDQVKQFGTYAIAAILIAAIVVSILIVAGVFAWAPIPRAAVFGIILPPEVMAFVGAFTMAITLILVYVYLAAFVRRTLGKVVDFWKERSTTQQALVLGLEAAIVATAFIFVIATTEIYPFEILEILIIGLVVFGLITYVGLQLVEQEWTISEWAKTLNSGLLAGLVVALLTAKMFTGVIDGLVIPIVFAGIWAGTIYGLYRRRAGMEDTYVHRILTKSGYAQMRQVDTLTVSIGSGLILAIVLGVITAFGGTFPSDTLNRVLLTVAIVWPAVTLATSVGWPNATRYDIVIEDISVRSSTGRREITFRNIGTRQINLRNAKLSDATNKHFNIGMNVTLSAGESSKFELPDSFELATHEPYEVADLPLGLHVTKDGTEPTIVTRDGREYVLRWIDQVS